jgi:predicted phage terminase large subunit-like protein
VLIVDDPIKAFDAESETERRRVNDWYDGSFLTRLDDQERGVVVVVHQRLHENDLSGHLLEKGGYELLALPAIATEGETLQIADEQFHTRAIGDVLDPSRLGPATLEGLKASIGSRNFQAQFQQQPVPAEGNLFKAVWLKRYTTVPPRESFSRIVQSWDCAAKLASTNDYSACLTWGISRNTYYLLDVHRSRWEFPDLSRAAIAHAEMLRPDTILIEDANSGSALLQWLRQETRLNVVPIKPKLDKATRAAQQSAAVESGRVYLPESASWLGEFERELLGFPNGKHDDQVDAMVQFLQWAAEAAAREGPIVLPAGPYKDWSWKDAG